MTDIAIEDGPVEIVDVFLKNGGPLQFVMWLFPRGYPHCNNAHLRRWRDQHRGGMQTPLGQLWMTCGSSWDWGIPAYLQYDHFIGLMMINHQIYWLSNQPIFSVSCRSNGALHRPFWTWRWIQSALEGIWPAMNMDIFIENWWKCGKTMP